MIRNAWMAHNVAEAVRAVREEFVAEARRRFPREEHAIYRRIAELTGIACLDDKTRPLAALREGRILVMKRNHPRQQTDRMLDEADAPFDADRVRQKVVSAATWLSGPPAHRIFVENNAHDIMTAVILGVYLDIQGQRATRPPSAVQSVSATLLHDVMATLHGYSRRVAGLVSTTWRAAACDVMLPVDRTDVAAWFEPRVAEMMRTLPQWIPLVESILMAWTLTQLWLAGYD
jgi:hypothetical protein